MAWTDWLRDANKRDMLKFLGGAAVALVGGGWTVYTWLHPKLDDAKAVTPPAAATVSPAVPPQPAALMQAPAATSGGVAVAISGNGNQVNTGIAEVK